MLYISSQGRHYMLSPEGTEQNQHSFVKRTLAGLMTPLLPPFYRLFMSGIVPSTQRGDPQWLQDAVQWIVGNISELPLPLSVKLKLKEKLVNRVFTVSLFLLVANDDLCYFRRPVNNLVLGFMPLHSRPL